MALSVSVPPVFTDGTVVTAANINALASSLVLGTQYAMPSWRMYSIINQSASTTLSPITWAGKRGNTIDVTWTGSPATTININTAGIYTLSAGYYSGTDVTPPVNNLMQLNFTLGGTQSGNIGLRRKYSGSGSYIAMTTSWTGILQVGTTVIVQLSSANAFNFQGQRTPIAGPLLTSFTVPQATNQPGVDYAGVPDAVGYAWFSGRMVSMGN